MAECFVVGFERNLYVIAVVWLSLGFEWPFDRASGRSREKSKFRGIFIDNFAEKTANFTGIFWSNFAEK